MPRFLACLVSLLILASASAQAADLADLFERVNPSVVVIQSQEQVARGTDQLAWRTIQRVGSGVLVSEDGRIVTAAHVVQSADQIQVSFADGSTVDARVIGSEPAADIALLKVEAVPASAAVARLGDSDGVRIGQPVFAIGAPHGLAHALSVGHISARHRGSDITGDFGLGELLQTDASLNRGNSGGPLFNHSGEVVGIVSRILTSSGGSQGLGFAVTSNQVRELLLEQRAFWNGLNGYWVQGNLARLLNIPQARGLLVQGMASGSPAARIGLRAGISFADDDGYQRVRQHLGGLNPGDSVTISVLRAGERISLTTTLGESD